MTNQFIHLMYSLSYFNGLNYVDISFSRDLFSKHQDTFVCVFWKREKWTMHSLWLTFTLISLQDTSSFQIIHLWSWLWYTPLQSTRNPNWKPRQRNVCLNVLFTVNFIKKHHSNQIVTLKSIRPCNHPWTALQNGFQTGK